MDKRRVRFVVVFVAFLCILVAVTSEGNRKIGDKFSGDGVPWNVQDIDEDAAEQVWIHCSKELKGSTEAFENFYLHLSQVATSSYDMIKSDSASLTKRIIHKAITDLPPEVKHSLLHCLRKKNISIPSSRKEAWSKNWFIKFQELLFGCYSVPRRYLVSKKNHHIAPSPAPAWRRKGHHIVVSPAPSPSPPTYAPAPSFPVPASSPSPILQAPVVALEPPLPQLLNGSPPSSAAIFAPPRPPDAPSIPSHTNNNNNRKYSIAIIATTAVATTALIALLLFCCLSSGRYKIGRPRDGQRDEKPLLFSSDHSAGSSQNSRSLGNSSNKDFRTSSVVRTLSISGDSHNSSLGKGQSIEATVEASKNTQGALPLPPGRTAPSPPGPPPTPPKPPAPSPPPPPKVARPPPIPPKPGNLKRPSPLGPHCQSSSSLGEGNALNNDSDAPKTKLKPFFWDKVLANPEHSMVWHDIKAGSFQFNEEMIETLFGYAPADKNKNERSKDSPSFDSPAPYIQIIDAKKSQNLAILLKALNVTTEEVCDALKEGNALPIELIQTLLKMAPTTEEELKLRLFSGDLCRLGPAEQFLKVLVNIPFAFKRLESLLFMSSLQEEVSSIKESFATLEVACKELRNSRLFLKLLEAVLKTGNRMNDGTYRGGAQAFKLDTLLKLSDVKGTDGKTTLLHFVVQEIIRSEGIRAARRLKESKSMSSVNTEDLVEESTQETAEIYFSLGLQVVSGLSNELENVRKAALTDGDSLTTTVSKLGLSLMETKQFLDTEMNSVEEGSEFSDTLSSFVQHAEGDITWLLEEQKKIMALVKSTGDYFHGNAGKDEGLHLFAIVRDFLIMLDKECKEVRNSAKMPVKIPKNKTPSATPSQESQQSFPDLHQKIFPSIRDQQRDDFSSDDESSSP